MKSVFKEIFFAHWYVSRSRTSSGNRQSKQQPTPPAPDGQYDRSGFPLSMTQSLGPEQLAHQLSEPADMCSSYGGYEGENYRAVNGEYGSQGALTNGMAENHSRPTYLFEEHGAMEMREWLLLFSGF